MLRGRSTFYQFKMMPTQKTFGELPLYHYFKFSENDEKFYVKDSSAKIRKLGRPKEEAKLFRRNKAVVFDYGSELSALAQISPRNVSRES